MTGSVLFLTGATGFVGANLAPLLHGAGYSLRCLLRPESPRDALEGVPHEVVAGTLDDEDALRRGVEGATAVVHLAALVSFRRRDRQRMFAINDGATARLAPLAREAGVGRFLHVSTISAVGSSRRPEVLDERAPYDFGPLHIGYCDSKHAAEQRVLAEVGRGLDAVIVNPPSMFGPGDRRKAEGSLLDVVHRGRARWAPPGGLNVADVASVCQGIVRALARGRTGERYILGGENLTHRELLTVCAEVVGARPPRGTLPRPVVRAAAAVVTAWERFFPLNGAVTGAVLRLAPRYQWYSSTKAERELGYEPAPVRPAIARAWQWTRELRGG